jgi:hypothetical protein
VATTGVPASPYEALLFEAAEDLVQDVLAGRLVAQPGDLDSRAARAKRTAVKRIKDRHLHRSEQIITSHSPSLGVSCGDATRVAFDSCLADADQLSHPTRR